MVWGNTACPACTDAPRVHTCGLDEPLPALPEDLRLAMLTARQERDTLHAENDWLQVDLERCGEQRRQDVAQLVRLQAQVDRLVIDRADAAIRAAREDGMLLMMRLSKPRG